MSFANINDLSNHDVEGGLLGGLIVHEDALPRVADRLQPEHFHLLQHQRIYETITKLWDQNRSITPITIKEHFATDEKIGEMSIAAYLLRLHAEATSIVNVIDYADIIIKHWSKRQAQRTAEHLVGQLHAPGIEPSEAIDEASDLFLDVSSVLNAQDTPLNLSAAVSSAERKMNGKAGEHEQGIPLPFPSVQSLLNNDLLPRKLYGLLAASNEGKTSFILQVMRHAAEQGHPSALLSFDQDPEDCLNQMTAQSLRIDANDISQNRLSDSNLSKVVLERRRISELPLSVILCPKTRMAGILKKADVFVNNWRRKTNKAPLVVIDHIKAARSDDPRADAGTQAQQKNRDFKDWAVARNAVAIMLNQRNSEGRRSLEYMVPRPTVLDLHGGESAKEDYDAVFALFRPSMWRDMVLQRVPENADEKVSKIKARYGDCDNTAECTLIKSRFSSLSGKATLQFEKEFTRFSEWPVPQEELFV